MTAISFSGQVTKQYVWLGWRPLAQIVSQFVEEEEPECGSCGSCDKGAYGSPYLGLLGGLVLFSPLAFVGAWRVRLRKGRKGEYLKIVALYVGLAGLGGTLSAWTYEDVEGTWVYNVYWYHTDHLGTPVLMTDKDGTVVWEMRLTPFGETAVLNQDPDQDGVEVLSNLRFPGQYYDEETGVHYNWNRYYENRAGRYISIDQISLTIACESCSSYRYVRNNPLILLDYKGLKYENPISEIVDAFCGVGLPEYELMIDFCECAEDRGSCYASWCTFMGTACIALHPTSTCLTWCHDWETMCYIWAGFNAP